MHAFLGMHVYVCGIFKGDRLYCYFLKWHIFCYFSGFNLLSFFIFHCHWSAVSSYVTPVFYVYIFIKYNSVSFIIIWLHNINSKFRVVLLFHYFDDLCRYFFPVIVGQNRLGYVIVFGFVQYKLFNPCGGFHLFGLLYFPSFLVVLYPFSSCHTVFA